MSLLLARHAQVHIVEKTFGGTPLTWALHGWDHARAGSQDRYYDVVERLVRAGARVNPAWFDQDTDQTEFGRKIRADAKMFAALNIGESESHAANRTE